MSVRDNILNSLAAELITISGTGAYETEVKEVKRGICNINDFNTIPGVSFWCYQDEIVEHHMDGGKLRYLHIYFYGYTNTIEEIHNFEDDIEYFLENDFTYASDTLIKTDTPIIIYEGGTTEATDDVAMFRLDIKIKYEQ